jgi:transcriptional regulator with XRE-family HTH domain
MASLYEKLGKQIEILRRRRGMTQEQLAVKAKIDLTTVSNIESGNRNPSLKTIYTISRALNTSLKELFDF